MAPLDVLTGLSNGGGVIFMTLIVKKKPGDSDDKVIRDFTRKVQDAGIVQEAKRRQFYLKPSAARAQKKQDKRKARLLKRSLQPTI